MTTLLRLNVLRYFLNETIVLRESPTDGLKEGSVSLAAFRLGSRINTGGGRQRGVEPEPDEESERLRGYGQVTLKTFRTGERDDRGVARRQPQVDRQSRGRETKRPRTR
jgi:hypothetical protein